MSSQTFFDTKEPGISQLTVKTIQGPFGDVPQTKESKDIQMMREDFYDPEGTKPGGCRLYPLGAHRHLYPGRLQRFARVWRRR